MTVFLADYPSIYRSNTAVIAKCQAWIFGCIKISHIYNCLHTMFPSCHANIRQQDFTVLFNPTLLDGLYRTPVKWVRTLFCGWAYFISWFIHTLFHCWSTIFYDWFTQKLYSMIQCVPASNISLIELNRFFFFLSHSCNVQFIWCYGLLTIWLF